MDTKQLSMILFAFARLDSFQKVEALNLLSGVGLERVQNGTLFFLKDLSKMSEFKEIQDIIQKYIK